MGSVGGLEVIILVSNKQRKLFGISCPFMYLLCAENVCS